MGVIGAAVGVGLGFAGAAIISKVAPKLSANVPTSTGGFTQSQTAVGARRRHARLESRLGDARRGRPVAPVHHGGVIVLAVILALAGGLLAGSFGSWRIARLRPATPWPGLRDSDRQDPSRTGEDPCTS